MTIRNIILLTLCFCASYFARSESEKANGSITNTCVRSMMDIWDRSIPGQHNLFAITGVVHTAHTTGLDPVFVQDFVVDDGELLISVFNKAIPAAAPKPGDRVVVSGIFGQKKYTYGNEPYAVAHKIDIIKSGGSVKPTPRKLQDLSSFSDNLRLIETEGTIIDWRTSEDDPAYLYLTLKDGPTTMPVIIPSENQKAVNHLLESKVRVVGTFNWALQSVRKYARPLIVSKLENIKLISPPPSCETIPLLERKIYQTPTSVRSLGKRKVRGEIIAVFKKRNLLLKDDDGRIVKVRLSHRNTVPPQASFHATIFGYPETDQFNIMLGVATISSCTPGTPKKRNPVEIRPISNVISNEPSGATLLNPSYYGKEVSVSGTIRNLPSLGNAEGHIGVDCGDHLILLDTSSCPEATAALELGCKIDATGICLFETNDYDTQTDMPHIRALTLVLRGKDDIKIIAHPPWLTPARFAVILSAMAGVLILFLIWNTSLRILVERRGRELARKQIEATNARFKTIERTRLATELHDSVVQNLTGAAMEIRAAQAALQQKDKDSAPHLDIALKTINSSRAELRNCIWDLRNEALEKNDIEESIRITLRPHLPESQLLIRFCVPRRKIPDNVFHNILCIIRELVVNAVRHGQAKRIKITGTLDKDLLIFSVSDNGVGFDPHNRPGMEQGHFGIEGVMERVKSLDGGIDITSALGDGTSVTVKIPIHQDA